MLSDTAHLVIEADLKNNVTPGASAVANDVKRVETGAASASSKVSVFSKTISGAGGALSHLKGSVTGLPTGPLGFLGLGALVGGVGDQFAQGVEKANEW